MNKLVSIILPIYNGERYMKKSIESIISQTYKNWELLILDDCSTDNTANIAKDFILMDSRIKYYRNEENLRLPKNLNHGFSLAKGDYLTWTSDDNMYKENAIEEMVITLEKEKVQFVYASCRIIDENDKEIEYIMTDQLGKEKIVGSNPVGACFMYTRKVYDEIGEYNPEFTLVEDFDYWQRIFARFKVYNISEILYYYRFHKGALTSTMKQETFNKTLEKVLLKNRASFGKISKLSKYYYYKGLYESRNGYCPENNPYINKYRKYNIYYLLFIKIPNKIKREIRKLGEKWNE